jgi:hypothetical protein
MIRILFILFIVLSVGFLFLQGRTIKRSSEKPIFLQTDLVAKAHQTNIDVTIHSNYTPNNAQLENLKTDYSNLWAHLNHLYKTNDIITGKEYYSEAWFRQIAHHYDRFSHSFIERIDLNHDLHIQNWSSDGLVCTVIDNVTLQYVYPSEKILTSNANLAIVLLYEGDHWRVDGMSVLKDTANPIIPTSK